MSQKVIFVCGNLSAALLLALLKRLPDDESQTLVLQLEEPQPPPTFLLHAPHEDVYEEDMVIPRDDHSGESLRAANRNTRDQRNPQNRLIRSRSGQSMVRRGKYRN